MRPVFPALDLFRGDSLPHEHARELEMIGQILCANPTVTRLVWKDLQDKESQVIDRRGRPGLSADVILRAAMIKQMRGFSYEELAFHLADSLTYRRFCGFTHPLDVPRKSALAKSIKRVSDATWQTINQVILQYAEARGVEDGRKVRIDATVTESNIHHPTDNALLFDCVRTLSRILGQARTDFGIASPNRHRAAKRRHMEIVNAKRNAQRTKPYRKLLKVTEETIRYSLLAIERLHQVSGPMAEGALRLVHELEHYIPLAHQVVSQTRRRVLNGESVPADEKIVSIFEPHTDIIRKDRRDTYYGHKVTLTGGASGLVLDWVVEEGNPADSTLLIRMLERQRDIYGHYPLQASVDGGYASKDNLTFAKGLGVQDMVFSKKRGLKVEDMVTQPWLFKKLRNFRAGIEGVISFLKRVFGLSRCTWKGQPSFASYVGASVVSANLLILARHLMS
jgi:transposase, IS5 family